MKNIFYMHKISAIGGVESFFYYLSKIYKDFSVYYKVGDPEQVKRLSKNIEVRKYTKPIKCDRLFSNYTCDIEFEAKEKYHIIHYDPLNVGFGTYYLDGWKYIGVSKVACKGFKEITGHEAELIYNVVPIEKPKVEKNKKLTLISMTRLTSEKGGNRINQLARMLDEKGIDYEWHIYTNRIRYPFVSNKIIVHEQNLNLLKEVAKASWLVQLSDCESFGLSVCESLILGTPVIITPLEAFKEIGCEHGKNACICDFNMKNVDIDMIAKGLPKFEYEPPKTNWDKYLKRTGTYDPNEEIEVRTKKRIFDIEKNLHYARNEIVKLTRTRASELECKDLVEII